MSKFRGAGKWKPDGPVRTNTGSSIRGRIGPPIPIADDDEFPIRTPGAGIATPLGNEALERQMRLRASNATDLENTAQQADIAVNDFIDPVQSTLTPTQQPIDEPIQRRTQPNALRTSVASMPSRSSGGKPQRKKSSLRSVLGRLFGKKRKGGSTSSNEREHSPGGARAGQHRSDPTALNRSPKEISPQKRSASLPINEFNRALRSHSTVTEDFPLQSTHGTNRESSQSQTRARRATTPSRLWTPNKTPGYVDWTGLSPRPASIHARGSQVISDPNANADADAAIGMAVTSGSNPNRRSRSLGELREVASPPPLTRRRSDEIRYWRESYDPGIISPMSSNKAEAEEPILPDEPEQPLEELEEPPQPFNFGPMSEMAGMKITQAASLETRVQRLEGRMQRIEKALQGHSSEALGLQDPPKRNPSRLNTSSSITRPTTDSSEISLPKHEGYRETRRRPQELDTQSSQKRSTSHDSRPSTVETGPYYQPSLETFPPPVFQSSQTALSVSEDTARPLSTSTTIRGIPSSSPTMPRDGGPLTSEHYSALVNMILAEQKARQQLEAVVHSLQQQLQQALHGSKPTSYPTPSSDHAANPLMEDKEFSSFEQDDSSDDEGRYGAEEVFQTPNEERGHYGDDTFGDVMSGEDVKTAPRTMSLSAMTLGKGMQHV